MSNIVYLSQAQASLSTQAKTFVDPIAQSFIVDTPGGAFVTSLNLYFSEKDPSAPISIDLRAMENGVPTEVVIPFSAVTVEAADVNVSPSASTPTKFTFQAPIFLLDTAEYCFVINTNSHLYKVWTARLGGQDVTRTGYSISKQPYNGVMFRSQNAGVWSPDQSKDIKFSMNRAEFVASGTAMFNESPIPAVELDADPFETTTSALTVTSFVVTSGPSTTVKANIASTTGINVDDRITIYGAVGTEQTKLNGSWVITAVNSTDFTFTVSSAVNTGTYTTGIGVTELGSKYVRVYHKNHGFFPTVSSVTISGVSAGLTFNGILGSALNGTHTVVSVEQDSYTFALTAILSGTAVYASTAAGRTGGAGVRVTENRLFDTTYLNIQNLGFKNTNADWSIKATSGKSLAGSETPYVLDSTWRNIAVNQNTEMDYPRVVRSDYGSSKSFFLRGLFSTSNSALSPVVDLNRTSLVAINNRIDNPASTESTGYNAVRNYKAETEAQGSSALSKYITSRIDLNTAASALRAFVSINRPVGSNVLVYYKVLPKGSDTDFDSGIGWSLVNPVNAVPTSSDPNTYTEIEYDVTETDLGDVQFTAFAFKIVFTSTNSSAVPSLQDFRAIAVT